MTAYKLHFSLKLCTLYCQQIHKMLQTHAIAVAISHVCNG